eukprot:TRINITY_DN8593_c2_g3_i2.p2 TRINITY_DN8593_c2_g3~~TRINITY_DN8593_c2_g3_i2.p2  ORF type:complete len:105 (-),score=9.55 TRINITY_DN8593_c2_g3_i2:5-319(-)
MGLARASPNMDLAKALPNRTANATMDFAKALRTVLRSDTRRHSTRLLSRVKQDDTQIVIQRLSRLERDGPSQAGVGASPKSVWCNGAKHSSTGYCYMQRCDRRM